MKINQLTRRCFLGTGLLAAAFLFSALPLAAQKPSDDASFRFTVTSDSHNNLVVLGRVFDGMDKNSGGPGAFHIMIGDLADHKGDTPAGLRTVIDKHYGPNFPWWPVVGNHDKSSPESTAFLREEFRSGNQLRTPIKERVKRVGPAGSVEMMYSWDFRNAHFVAINPFWNGALTPGSDAALNNGLVPEVIDWLKSDLAANDKPFVFVFVHEPAFALDRHIGSSLDANPDTRDALWTLLSKYKVQVLFSGHIHSYYKILKDGVYQIVDDCAGRTDKHYSYMDVTVQKESAVIKAWRYSDEDGSVWKQIDETAVHAAEAPMTK